MAVKWDLILGAVAIIIGIPSLIALYSSGETAVAIMGLVAAGILVAATLFVKDVTNKPGISVDFQKMTLSFEQGRAIANVTKQYEFRVHRKDLSHWVHRNISADGQIQNLCWDGTPIPPADQITRCNDLEVTTRSPYPWPTGRKLQGTLTYQLCNSFPSNVEFLQYTSDIPTKLAVMRVNFGPKDRCTSASVSRRANGVTETLEIVDRDPSGAWLQVEIKKPRGGHEYVIYWHW